MTVWDSIFINLISPMKSGKEHSDLTDTLEALQWEWNEEAQ